MFQFLMLAVMGYGYWCHVRKTTDAILAMIAVNTAIINTFAQVRLPGATGLAASLLLGGLSAILLSYAAEGRAQ